MCIFTLMSVYIIFAISRFGTDDICTFVSLHIITQRFLFLVQKAEVGSEFLRNLLLHDATVRNHMRVS